MPKISFITIGNELLRGRIVNTNATEVGKILRKKGYTLDRVLSVADTQEAILAAVEAELKSHDVVLLSGGLGPTKDDVTKHSLKEWSNSEWVWHQPTLDFLEKRYASRKRALTELSRQQARVPSACEVIHNPNGTAPGMLFKRGEKLLFSMPGVPFELLHLVEHEVIERIQKLYPQSAFRSAVIRVADIPESRAAERLENFEATIPNGMLLSYLPRHDGLWLELSFQLPDSQLGEIDLIFGEKIEELYALMKDKAYTRGDKPISEVVKEAFMERGLTLAVAESLTGGNVSGKLVKISGASTYYKGSVTAYAVQAKEEILQVPKEQIVKYGVVSAEVAKAMAIGVRKLMHADIGLGTTGYAESDEGIQAHAFLGYADNKHSDAKEVRLMYKREVNIERCSNYLLQWCLKKLRETLD
ncbi:MAG: nicotinamide-nucleotide amidohydrolase family protein [Bacteroidota bacterium]